MASTQQVWYVGYGSNLCRERFVCYIKGGQFRLGGRRLDGCKDRTPPADNEPFVIPHVLSFAGHSEGWRGAMAFISPTPLSNSEGCSFARMWKVTRDQFEDIWDQEGRRLYDREVILGIHRDGTQIATITSSRNLPSGPPSEDYLRTIVLGLRETFKLSNGSILDYLIGTAGVQDRFSGGDLSAIIASTR